MYSINPVFVIGCWHSGTRCAVMLLEQKMYSLATNEQSKDFAGSLSKKFLKKLPGRICNDAEIVYFRKKILDECISKNIPKGSNVVIKLPIFSFLGDFLYAAFPNARFVHIIRNGLDVVCSTLGVHLPSIDNSATNKARSYMFFGNKNNTIRKIFGVNLNKINTKHPPKSHLFNSLLWNRATEHALSNRNKLYYEVKYEDLVTNRDKQIELLKFCEVDTDVNFSVIEQKHVNRWKNLLSPDETKEVIDIIKDLMTKLKYDWRVLCELFAFCSPCLSWI